MSILRKRAIVEPGGRVQISSEELPAGATVEVSVETIDPAPPKHLRDLRGSGKGVYSSPEDVDAYIRALRDEWDS